NFSGFEDLSGGRGADIFLISGAQAARLSGGAGNDSFVMADGASLDGSVDGGSGTDTLDWSAYTAARSVTLSGPGVTDGFAGGEASLGGGFTDMDKLVGSGSTGDHLTGLNAAATWDVAAPARYTASGRSLGFAAIENLTGGSGDDLFRVTSAPGGVLDG